MPCRQRPNTLPSCLGQSSLERYKTAFEKQGAKRAEGQQNLGSCPDSSQDDIRPILQDEELRTGPWCSKRAPQGSGLPQTRPGAALGGYRPSTPSRHPQIPRAPQKQMSEESLCGGDSCRTGDHGSFLFLSISRKPAHIHEAHVRLCVDDPDRSCLGGASRPAEEAARVTAQGQQVPWVTGQVLPSLGGSSGKGRPQADIRIQDSRPSVPCFLPPYLHQVN